MCSVLLFVKLKYCVIIYSLYHQYSVFVVVCFVHKLKYCVIIYSLYITSIVSLLLLALYILMQDSLADQPRVELPAKN